MGLARLGRVVILAALGAEPIATPAGGDLVRHAAWMLADGTGPEPLAGPKMLGLLCEQVQPRLCFNIPPGL